MIKKLRIKFITLSMLALFLLLSIIVSGMNVLNYKSVIGDADQTLTIIAKNRGQFPDVSPNKKEDREPTPHPLSPEAPYESRYFSVLLDSDGNTLQTDTGKIKSVDTKTAIAYAKQILSEGKSKGFLNHFRFLCEAEGDNTRIIFLDCGRKMDSFYTFLIQSIVMALLGYILFFFVILFFSGKIIRPVAESYEKQKRFITDASHELKTPLTIIKADTDILEMECEGNEWVQDIKKQADRLTALTNDLVYLTRMEESGNNCPMIEFPFSDVISETAASFQAPAKNQSKIISCDIKPMLSMTGNEKAIRQLLTILLDNALKYSPEGSTISVRAEKQGKHICLTVENATTDAIDKQTLPLLFDRFYRMDSSRNSQTGGYGIGLSIAKAIVNTHGGKIQADTKDGHTLCIFVLLPA